MSEVNRHARTRRDHYSETAEDYVEAIYEILQKQETCRNADLARHFAVSAVTSSKIVSRLVTEGLVSSAPYGPVSLTETGLKLAQTCQSRHQTVVKFLKYLGVPAEIAEMDAEGIEHHISDATLDCMLGFIDRLDHD